MKWKWEDPNSILITGTILQGAMRTDMINVFGDDYDTCGTV